MHKTQPSRPIKDYTVFQPSSVYACIYPHPDDETFANAGLIQQLLKEQIAVHMVCLTKGAASTLNFSQLTDLKSVREQEFKEVTKYLGVQNSQLEDFPDGELESLEQELTVFLRKYIEKIKPTHICTFEPGGLYGHPDHIIVSSIITKLSTDYLFKIVYATVPSHIHMSPSALAMAKNPAAVQPLQPNYIYKLSWSQFVTKLKALTLYKSQVSMKHETLHKLKEIYRRRFEWYYISDES